MARGRLFITGFPGFIASRLVRRLTADDPKLRVTCLVEPKMAARARDVAAEIDAERIEVIEGDIAEHRLGLADAAYQRLTAETSSVHHLAAIYNLAVPLELAQRVNVDGTGNVLDFCLDCENLERLNYVSTAYVAGVRKGIVYEHELALGQDFKNHYESTKFQAEVWVREKMHRLPVTVYRPAIVVGDSKTGETQKFDGPYYMLRVVSRGMRLHLPIPRFGRSHAPFNVVPVDYIVDALAAAGNDPKAVGETLHLVDPEPVTAREIMTILSREYAGRDPAYALPAGMVASMLKVAPIRASFAGAPSESIRYLSHPVRFDTRCADSLLERHGLRCPRFEEYVDPLVRFFREHEDEPAYAPWA